jgi:hypothetical protein
MRRLRLVFLAVLFISPVAIRADVHCAMVFGDHIVLQRERPILMWGEAVTVDFAGQRKAVTAPYRLESKPLLPAGLLGPVAIMEEQ